MAASTCFVCQKHPRVWAACVVDVSTLGAWLALPHTVRWELQDNVTEAGEILTSDTGGNLVKPCPDTVQWTLEVDSALCDDDFIYDYLLLSNNPSDTATLAVFASWGYTSPAVPAGLELVVDPSTDLAAGFDKGILGVGTVTPGGVGIDGNNSANAAQTTWRLALTETYFNITAKC